MATIDTRIQLKRGLSTDWTEKNPVLLAAEIGVETDTNKFKIGDGITAWNSLSYQGDNFTLDKGFVGSIGEAFPTLTENGTMGGETNACACGTKQYEPYLAFNGDVSNYWGPSSSSTPQWITYYSATPRSLSRVKYVFPQENEAYSAGYLDCSMDNTNWTRVATFSGNSLLTCIIDITDNREYKYFRTTFTTHLADGGYGKANIFLYGFDSSTLSVGVDEVTTYINDSNRVAAYIPAVGEGLTKGTVNRVNAPTLAANGTMGGSSPACYADQNSSDAWKAFARNQSLTWGLKNNISYITYYNPTLVTLASLSVSYNNSSADPSHYSSFQATVLGSVDNEAWEIIGSFKGSKTEQPYSTTTFKPTVFKKYKYFRVSFNVSQYYDSDGIRIYIDFGEPATNVNVDDNTIKINSNNKLYAPTILQEVNVPLAYSSLSVGGMTAYTITSGYLVPTYTSNFQAYFSSGDSYVNVYNSNKTNATSVEEAFYQTSYIDIPCDVDKMVKRVKSGDLNSVDCLFSSLTSGTTYQSPVWIAGNWDGTTFTPLLFGYAASMMGGAVTFLTGGYTAGGEYENGFTADSTTYTYGSTMLNDGAGFAIRYNGSTWQITCSYTDPYGYESMEYHTTAVTSAQVDKLAQINVVRYVNMSGNSTAANNPTVAGFGYNNGTWVPGDSPVKYNTLVLNYDNDTLKVDGNNKLYADVQGGDSLPDQTGQSGKFLTTDGTDASWANIPTEIPSQSGNSGKFLTTDGTDTSWATVSGSLPTQTGQSGKFLTTDGTDASWANVSGSLPTQTGQSGKFLTTDGTDASWATVSGSLPSQAGQSGKFLTTDGTNASWAEVQGGGTGPGRNTGEFVVSSTPLTDAGLHLLDGTNITGTGIYSGFVDYIADLYNDNYLYAYVYNDGSDDHIIYTKTTTIESDTTLYNADGTTYSGEDFSIVDNSGYEIQYDGNACAYTSADNIALADFIVTESEWQDQYDMFGKCAKYAYTPASGNDPAVVRLPKINFFYDMNTGVGYEDMGAFVQPTLTSNGTMGGDSCACESSGYEGSYYPYYAFDSDPTNTRWGPNNSPSTSSPKWLTFYSPDSLRVSSVVVTFYSTGESFNTGYLSGSNDNTNWTQLATFSGNSAQTLTLNVTNENLFKYIRLTATSSNSGWGKVTNMAITAHKMRRVDYEQGYIYNYVCLANVTKTEIEVDIDEVASDLNALTATATQTSTDLATHINSMSAHSTLFGAKQDTLVSGTNIKTINEQSILGEGNIDLASLIYDPGVGLKKDYVNAAYAPALSSNGTMGGGSAACTASSNTSNAWYGYRRTGNDYWTTDTTSACWSTYYNPTAVYLASITYVGRGNPTEPLPYSCTLYGSNDNENWTVLGSYTNDQYTYSTQETIVPIIDKKFKYFKSSFSENPYANYGTCVDMILKFGTPAYSANIDDNTIKVSSSNKLYVPEKLPEVIDPLTYNVLSIGGMTNYSINSGYLKPTYPSNLMFDTYGEGYVMVYNSNKPSATSVEEAFYQTSYIDIPCDVDKLVAEVKAGERSSVNCLFSSYVGSSGYQNIAWIAGHSDGTTFTPLLFAMSGEYSSGVTFLTGDYTAGGEYANGFTKDSTSSTSGSTSLGSGSHMAITYNGSAWQVMTSSINYGYTMEYHTTSITSAQVDKLAQINVVRFVNISGNSTTNYNPLVEGFGYNNSTWTPADGAQDFYTLAVKYDDETVFLNEDGELAAQGGGGSTRNVGEIVTSALPITDQGLHLLDGALLSGDGVYADFVTYIAGLYTTTTVEQSWAQPTLSSNSSYGTVTSVNYVGSHAPWKVFDGSTSGENTKFLTEESDPWITWQLPSQIKVQSCKIYQTTEGSVLGRFPSSITLQGSNDGTTWSSLGTVSVDAAPASGNYVTLTVSSPTYYSYYKWSFGSSISGDSYMAISEIQITALEEVEAFPNYFCTEAQWQTEVLNKGVCGKFVYTAAANDDPATVRLPLVTGLIRHINSIVDLGDVVTDIETSASGDINSTKLISYIAVADTEKSKIKVDVDNIIEDLDNKVDYSSLLDAHVVIATGSSGTSWYRLYSDGWCEQGGLQVCTADTNTAVTLLQDYANTNYIAIATYNDTTAGEASGVAVAINSKAVDGFSIGSPGGTIAWQTSGFVAAE